jgi:predicted GNAT superfamily acetyltransferase
MSSPITVRKCHGMEDFQNCVALQKEIWGEADLEVEPVTLFVVASETGGQVLGAFDGDRQVAFTLAVPGFLEGRVFLHSHMTGVLKEYRDRGVGRALKLFQREEALGRGIRLIVWTFDPLETRNGHFNLNRLGAISRRYLPNLYGVTSSPLHWGLPTDRLWVEWPLDAARVMKAVVSDAGGALESPGQAGTAATALVAVPGEVEEWKRNDEKRLAAEQTRIREEFTRWFAKGYAAVGVRKIGTGAEYMLAPWSEF